MTVVRCIMPGGSSDIPTCLWVIIHCDIVGTNMKLVKYKFVFIVVLATETGQSSFSHVVGLNKIYVLYYIGDLAMVRGKVFFY